ncbi:MAG TPA: type II toxin-antitoxin system RelE/ParE family toxin [Acidobacteriaceae bacterium]|nr:type II toxin-antitoxin system RelE/ParE family toxin [Acidobacteriaceae bacterium]
MFAHAEKSQRVFKSAWFSKAARKAHISDNELCEAIKQVALGQADNLGGGVFKKRLKKNQYRSIILARSGRYWIYEYLFSKQDRVNIDDDELAEFRELVKIYGALTAQQIELLLRDNDWMEICHGKEA